MAKRFQAVYRRWYETQVAEFATLEQAVGMLQWGSDFGALYAVGVWDREQRALYLPRGGPRGADELVAVVVEALSLEAAPAVAGTFAGWPGEEE